MMYESKTHYKFRLPNDIFILWNSMPDTIKSVENVFRFKKGIKALNGDKCSCNICK